MRRPKFPNVDTNSGQHSAAAAGGLNPSTASDASAASAMQSNRRPAAAGPIPGISCATRNPDTRSRGFSAQRMIASTSLMCAASRKLKPAEFDERNVAAGELDFERGAMMRRAEKDRLRFERDACFAIFQNSFDDVAGLRNVVGDVYQHRPLRRFRSDRRFLVNCSAASSMTALAALRIGTVER